MTDLETTERPLSRDYSAIAERLAADCAREAAELDRDETFVAGNYEKAKAAGLIDAGVPAELGGGGADVRALCDILRRLAHGCSSTALALSMHTHQVAFPAWRWHHQQATRDKTEPLLRRIAAEKLVLLSSGGGDWIGGSGKAAPVEGGYRIIARKMFVSGAPAGDILMTSAISPEDGGTIIHFPCPMSAPEVTILDTWHTLGMRATGSHDVMIDGLFVPAEKVAVKRPQGRWHPLFFMLGTIAFPLIYAVYLGIAERARDLAVGFASARPASPRLRDRAGRMDTALTPGDDRKAAGRGERDPDGRACPRTGGRPGLLPQGRTRAAVPRHPGGALPSAAEGGAGRVRRRPRTGPADRRDLLIPARPARRARMRRAASPSRPNGPDPAGAAAIALSPRAASLPPAADPAGSLPPSV